MSGWGSAITGSTAKELAASIETAIRRGVVAPGEELPPVRVLASTLSLSPTTVSGALALLRHRGLIVSEERRASRVSPTRPLAPSPPLVRDLRHGGPDPALLPDIRPALRRAADELSSPRMYGLSQVDPDLAALARQRFEASGIDPANLFACGGALDGVQRALELAVSPGDLVAVEDPGYADHFDLVRALGVRLAPVPVDDDGLDPEMLEKVIATGARAVIITPVGQNPQGSSVTAERAEQLNRILRSSPETLLVEDQHLSLVTHSVHTASDGLKRWMVVRSLAKSLGPDLRLAVAVGDRGTVERIASRMAVGPGWISYLLQRTAVHLLRDQAVAQQLLRTSRTYDARRQALLSALQALGVNAFGRSGLNVWIPVDDEGEVAVTLAEEGWTIAPGAPFRIGSSPGIRVTTSTLPETEAPRVADAVARTLQSRPRRRG
jgi:DNA-binding transcriptional MocR family regulator